MHAACAATAAVPAAVRISRRNDTGVSCSLEGLIKPNQAPPVLECGTPLPDLRQTVSPGLTQLCMACAVLSRAGACATPRGWQGTACSRPPASTPCSTHAQHSQHDFSSWLLLLFFYGACR